MLRKPDCNIFSQPVVSLPRASALLAVSPLACGTAGKVKQTPGAVKMGNLGENKGG
jgi:hypothetical protein